jgi:hypothetical protein
MAHAFRVRIGDIVHRVAKRVRIVNTSWVVRISGKIEVPGSWPAGGRSGGHAGTVLDTPTLGGVAGRRTERLTAGRPAPRCHEHKESDTDTQRFHEVPVASSVNAIECGRLGPQIVYERLLGLSVLLSLRISVSTAGSVTKGQWPQESFWSGD